jgi:hypothetical protein
MEERTEREINMHKRITMGKPLGKGPLETPRKGWEDNIKMNARKIYCGG